MDQNGRTDRAAPTSESERRRYNRRTNPANPSPPYFEVFERIAVALEGIAEVLTETSSSPSSTTTQGTIDIDSPHAPRERRAASSRSD